MRIIKGNHIKIENVLLFKVYNYALPHHSNNNNNNNDNDNTPGNECCIGLAAIIPTHQNL